MSTARGMTLSLELGACPVEIVGSAIASPANPIDTPALLERLTPGLPAARRAALLAHLEDELGVESRAHLAPGEDPIALAVDAARAALGAGPSKLGPYTMNSAGSSSGNDEASACTPIGALLLATSTASRWTTAESARLAQALGLRVAFCDLKSGCTAGLWALVEGARLARDSGRAVLVVGCDSFSRAFAPAERLLPLGMGDGAAALVLAPASHDGGLVRALFGGEPELVDLATVPARLPPMTPAEPFVLAGDPDRFALATEAALRSAVGALAPPPDSLLVPHVSRIATARRLAAATGLSLFADGFVAHGNLGAAALLTALHLVREGHLRSPAAPAQHVALVSAGGGLSYGAALWRLPATS